MFNRNIEWDTMGKKQRKERRHIRADAEIMQKVDRLAIKEHRPFSLQVELMLEMALHTLARPDKRKAGAQTAAMIGSERFDHG